MFKQDRNSFYSWCPATLHYLDRYVLPVAILEIEIQFKIWFLILYVMRSLLIMCIFRMWCWAKVVLFKFAFFHLKFGQYVHANQHITMATLNIFPFAVSYLTAIVLQRNTFWSHLWLQPPIISFSGWATLVVYLTSLIIRFLTCKI